MLSLLLLLTMSCAFATEALLSMLLLLVASYLAAAFWLINMQLTYIGLLYVLVYVGAIVVLFVYVIQLVNTDITSSTNYTLARSSVWLLLSLAGLTLLFSQGQSSDLFALSLTDTSNCIAADKPVLQVGYNSLSLLAQSLFCQHAYVLILTAHAIILAVIGPINLALISLRDEPN